MGLFDGSFFDPAQFGGGSSGVLPPWLAQTIQDLQEGGSPMLSAFAQQQFPMLPQQTPIGSPMGLGQLPQQPGAPMAQGDAAPPQSRGVMPSALGNMPTPQMPSLGGLFGGGAAQSASSDSGSPGVGDRIMAGLMGFTQSHSPMSALGNLVAGAATGERSDPAGMAQQAQKAALQYVAQNGDLDPALKKTLLASPALALELVHGKIKPEHSADITEYEYAKKQGFAGTLTDWIQRKRAGAGEYGLQPIWGTDAQGNPTIVQLGKSGEAVQSKLPAGVHVGKDVVKVDAGTHWVLLDPVTRATISVIPKNIEAKEIAEKVGAATGEGKIALPTVISNAERMERQIAEVQNHPGRNSATGPILGRVPGLAGAQLDFVERMDQLKGQAFLQAFQTLKGAGAITEIEGSKATSAIGRLSRAKDAKDIDAALNDLREVISTGVRNAKIKAGVPQSPAAPTVRRYNPATGTIE
jgi:hypothetical protein